MMPANAANPAPSAKTIVNKRDTLMPTTRAMSGSSTPARIMAPRRVRSSSSQRAIATMAATTMIVESVVGDDQWPGTQKAVQLRGTCNVDRIAAPHHQAEIGGDERDAECHQHLRQLLAGQLTQQESLE